MPHLSIQTNVPRANVPADLPGKIITVMSETLNKPYEACSVTIIPDVIRNWGGSLEPSAHSYLTAIGHLGKEENVKHTKALSEVISIGLGIELAKTCIWFFDVDSNFVGNKGTTVFELRK